MYKLPFDALREFAPVAYISSVSLLLVVAGFDVVAWFGLYAPASIPKEVATTLNVEASRILRLPAAREKCAGLGAESKPMTNDQFERHLRAEIAKFAKASKESGGQWNAHHYKKVFKNKYLQN